MISAKPLYLGIDLTGRKPVYAVLDHERRPVQAAGAPVEDLLAYIETQPALVVAVNAPARPNLGLLARPDFRARMDIPARLAHLADLRLADYLLRSLQVPAPAVPRLVDAAPAWMQRGYAFHKGLGKLGCKPYPAENAERQVLETNPQAVFTALLGHAPLARHSLEGRIQRQLLLHEEGLGLLDPMDFFEEITRRKLLLGLLPLDKIYHPAHLDALAAAFTAWLAAERPDEVTLLGDGKEGRLVVPAGLLKEKPHPASPSARNPD